MTSRRRRSWRSWRRWLPLSVALVALAGVILWQASGFVAALVLEKQLRDGAWPDARVDGGALAFPDVAFERIVLAPEGRLVAEDVHARLGRGVERITIARLRAELEVTSDGEWLLPGGGVSGNAAPPLDLLPPDGILLDRAEIRVTTPAGIVGLTMTDVVVERIEDLARLSGAFAMSLDEPEAAADPAGLEDLAFALSGRAMAELGADGRAGVRLRVDDGALAAAGAEATGLTGEVAADLPSGGSPSLEVTAKVESAVIADVGLGALAVEAGWRGGAARFNVTTPVPDFGDISIDGEAVVSAAEPRRLTGRLRVQGRDLVYPGVFTDGALDLSADIAGDADELRVTMSEFDARMTPAPALVPDAARALDNEAISVRLVPVGDRRPTLRWALAEESAEIAANVEARSRDARVATRLHATVTRSRARPDARAPGSPGFAIEAELSDLVARNLPWDDAVLGLRAFDGTIEHDADGWRIDGAGTLDAAGAFGSVRVDGATAEWAGSVTGTSARIVLTANDCIEWTAESIAIDTVHVGGLAPVCIAPGNDGVLLSREIGANDSAFTFSIAEQPLEARIDTGDASYAIDGTWPRLAVSGTTSEAKGSSVTLSSSGGALTLPDARLALAGLEGSAELRDGALAAAALRVGRIEALATPAPIVPVGLELTADRMGAALTLDAIVSDDLGTFVLEAAGRHERGRTSADVRLYPVRFITGATEIGDLSPLLAEHVADASGLLEVTGNVEWTGTDLAGNATVKITDFSGVVAGTPVTGLSTETRFTSLAPPATAPEQTVTVERVVLGMPLEDGVAVFDLGASGELAFHRIELDLAGGRLFAEPFIVDSANAADIGFVLRAEDVELSHFLALSQIEGLAGTGVLSGRVPVRWTDGGIRLDEGVLAAETDGVLRYTPENLPDFLRGDDVRSRMLREVLTNFHYEELSLAVSGDSAEGGEQRLTLSARGANPDFLDGHPIELSFNFRGPLLGAVRSAVDLTDAAELEQIFEQRETENAEDSR